MLHQDHKVFHLRQVQLRSQYLDALLERQNIWSDNYTCDLTSYSQRNRQGNIDQG
jgi:hypothetical protein